VSLQPTSSIPQPTRPSSLQASCTATLSQASNNPPISPQDPSSLLRTYQYQLQNSKHPEFHLIYHRIPNTSNPKPNPRTSMRHLYNFVLYHIRRCCCCCCSSSSNLQKQPLSPTRFLHNPPKKIITKNSRKLENLGIPPDLQANRPKKKNQTLKNSKPSPTIQRKEKRLLLRQRQEYHRAQTLRASPPRAAPPHANPVPNLDNKIGTHERVTRKTATAQSGRPQQKEGSSAVEWGSYSHRHVRPSTSYPVAPLLRPCLCGSVFFLANYRLSTFFKGQPPVKRKKGWRGAGGRRIIKTCWKTRNGKVLWARKLGYDMVESSPYIPFQGVNWSHGEP
jgi:hypothetical protein